MKTKYKNLLATIPIILVVLILSINQVFANVDSSLSATSYPTSYPNIKESVNDSFEIINGKVFKTAKGNPIEIDSNEGFWDQNKNMFYYTIKSSTSWGAEKYIYVYSLKDKKVIKQIEFDNSGYYKYPISISPDSKTLVLAERAQSAGEVRLSLIDIYTGRIVTDLNGLYTPETKWIDDNVLIYLSPNSSCVDNHCTQVSLSLKKYNIKDKNFKTKKVADKLSNGTLPYFDHIEIKNGKAFLGRKNKVDGKDQPNSDVDINF
ncbi:MAG: hypothetical protein ABI721_03740 [Candidatus Dojkabacteria bacterium]